MTSKFNAISLLHWRTFRDNNRANVATAVHKVRLRLRFIYHNYWAAWDLVSLSQSHHVNTYTDIMKNPFVAITNRSPSRIVWTSLFKLSFRFRKIPNSREGGLDEVLLHIDDR